MGPEGRQDEGGWEYPPPCPRSREDHPHEASITLLFRLPPSTAPRWASSRWPTGVWRLGPDRWLAT